MYKHVMQVVCLLFLAQICFATTCPNIKDIKETPLTGWKAYDSDDAKPLSSARLSTFKQFAAQFALAEWASSNKKTGSIHCYYRDKAGSVLEAYLAKDHYVPSNSKNFWYEASEAMHCAAGNEKCEFNEVPLAAKQLARK